MLWAELGCRLIPYESFHVTYSIYATASTLPVTFRVKAGAEGSLAEEALQGRGRNTLKTAQKRTREDTSLPPTGQSKQKLRNHLTAQTGKGLEEPCGLGSAAACGGGGGQQVNKVSGRIPLHPPYSNKSLNFSESSKSPYPSGSKADLKQRLLTDYPLPESFLLHIS